MAIELSPEAQVVFDQLKKPFRDHWEFNQRLLKMLPQVGIVSKDVVLKVGDAMNQESSSEFLTRHQAQQDANLTAEAKESQDQARKLERLIAAKNYLGVFELLKRNSYNGGVRDLKNQSLALEALKESGDCDLIVRACRHIYSFDDNLLASFLRFFFEKATPTQISAAIIDSLKNTRIERALCERLAESASYPDIIATIPSYHQRGFEQGGMTLLTAVFATDEGVRAYAKALSEAAYESEAQNAFIMGASDFDNGSKLFEVLDMANLDTDLLLESTHYRTPVVATMAKIRKGLKAVKA